MTDILFNHNHAHTLFIGRRSFSFVYLLFVLVDIPPRLCLYFYIFLSNTDMYFLAMPNNKSRQNLNKMRGNKHSCVCRLPEVSNKWVQITFKPKCTRLVEFKCFRTLKPMHFMMSQKKLFFSLSLPNSLSVKVFHWLPAHPLPPTLTDQSPLVDLWTPYHSSYGHSAIVCTVLATMQCSIML